MELTSENVRTLFMDCLLNKKDGEEPPKETLVEGLVRKFVFRRDSIEKHANDIKDLLDQLPNQFTEDGGGGWTFLEMCTRKDGTQWGEHRNCEELLCLGIASGWVKFLLPREIWGALPGGVPYFVINKERVKQNADS